MTDKPTHRVTNIRKWRLYRGHSLDTLADLAHVDKGNLSKLERGILQYSQDLLERIAAALETDPASLIARDPEQGDGLWSAWEAANDDMREQIERVVSALVATKNHAPK